VLGELNVPVPASSQEGRFALLERYWPDTLDERDMLSTEADADLMGALEQHVSEHEAFYLALSVRS
jgi:hypothetical protein